MSTQSIGTFRQRWVTFLFGEGWRNPVVAQPGVETATFRLVRNELVRVQKGSGLRAVCVRHGIVWLTGTPACGDVILRQGDRFEFENQWPFVLQAMEDAEIELAA